jgi:hypothetical protein
MLLCGSLAMAQSQPAPGAAAAPGVSATPQTPPANPPQKPTPSGPQQAQVGPFDPINYVRIYEETSKGRILLFEPPTGEGNGKAPAEAKPRPTLMRADEDSKIVIELVQNGLIGNLALNGLFMSGELSRGDASATGTNVEILNYSEIAQDPRTQASQAGVALRTANEVKAVVQNLYELTRDLVGVAYGTDCYKPRPENGGLPDGCTFKPPTDPAAAKIAATTLQDYLRAVQPRINAIADFFANPRNALVMTVIGERVFGLDTSSVRSMAEKIRQDVAAVVTNGDTAGNALKDLHVNIPRLWEDMRALRAGLKSGATGVDDFFNQEWQSKVVPQLKNVLAPGTIDLRKYKASDGETLTVIVQARGAGGEGTGGISRDFQIAVKRLHPRVTTEPSAFYLHRNGTIRNEAGEVIDNNFAPAPGVTFGVVFYGRNEWLKIFAPGVGVNVSFMNFAANDFDPSIANAEGEVVGGFRSTTSSSIQLGTGASVGLFSNAVQFTYGWNLNVSHQRAYWGVGFGFLEIGQQIARFAKK